ncbi:MAG: hypothetical protein M1825_000731 [Sarcosagium campestre]|nr:MAG: hypothetical protein M1825_000731 [Sarcosagium campestre]
MNRFRTRKKSAGAAQASEVAERGSKNSISSKSFKRTKKQPPMPEPVFDLTNALPPSDDFRTSLLMPNLSARFSMLRQQDDPSTLIGKASDDSVLAPRRASRINVLSDIQEVASINESIRPPFALERSTSYGSVDGYATDDDSAYAGSMLGRAKPGEGNNLFGGRQKVYRIPMGGTTPSKDLGGSSTRFLYEDDVHTSAFQKLRQKEKEQEGQLGSSEARRLDADNHTESRDRANSPPPSGYNRNRETSSSTNSGPSFGRTSTAATSIASQGGITSGPVTPAVPHSNFATAGATGAERAGPKSRRLYDQGLDQQLHDQQSNAFTRLEQLSRLRMHGTGTPPPGQMAAIPHSHSASNLHDRYERAAHPPPRSGTTGNLASGPTPSASPANLGSFRFGLDDHKPSPSGPQVNLPHSPPLSPVSSEDDENSILPAAIQPNDRGKATALGAFNKPKVPYSEQQFSERQVQLQKGRETPPSRRGSPPRSDLRPSMDSDRKRSEDNSATPAAAWYPKRHAPPSGTPSLETCRSGRRPSQSDDADESMDLSSQGTFLAPMSPSDVSSAAESETEGERLVVGGQRTFSSSLSSTLPDSRVATGYPSSSKLVQSESADVTHDDARIPPNAARKLSEEPLSNSTGRALPANEERPHLTPEPPAELSGLVRQHLRNDSGQSSNYDDVSPSHSRLPSADLRPARLPPVVNYAEINRGNPWNKDGTFNGQYDGVPAPLALSNNQEPNNGAVKLPSIRSLQGLQPRQGPTGQLTPTDGVRADQSSGNVPPSPTKGSTLGSDWAQRRRMVQENLRRAQVERAAKNPALAAHVGQQRRASPPYSTASTGPSSEQSTASSQQRPDPSAKAMKTLGISDADAQHRPTHKRNSPDERWREEEEKMLQSIARTPQESQGLPNSWQQIRQDAQRAQQQAPRKVSDPTHPTQHQRISPPSSRGRAASSSPSKAQAGQRRGEVHKPQDPSRPFLTLSEPSSSENVQTAATLPSSNPRPSAAEHFGSKNLGPLQTGGGQSQVALTNPPRASPSSPFSGPLSPSREGVQMGSSQQRAMHRKRTINKGDISEPTLLSRTSNISTVNLPPGASLSNGAADVLAESAAPPPLPPLNPRRKHKFGGAFSRSSGSGSSSDLGSSSVPIGSGRSSLPGSAPSSGAQNTLEHGSVSSSSAAGPTPPSSSSSAPKHKLRLRKTSSEGGNMNVVARMHALAAPSPSVPTFPQSSSQASPTVVNGMF